MCGMCGIGTNDAPASLHDRWYCSLVDNPFWQAQAGRRVITIGREGASELGKQTMYW
jgi:hypothetical protein